MESHLEPSIEKWEEIIQEEKEQCYRQKNTSKKRHNTICKVR
jgi:16S rRNA U1498 N3-methylase RsmE